MKKLTPILWMIINLVASFSGGLLFVFLTFFIWSEEKSLGGLVSFYLYFSVSMLLGAFLSTALAQFIPFKIILSLSFFLRALIVYFLVQNISSFQENIEIIAVILGISSRLMTAAQNMISSTILSSDESVIFNSYKEIISAGILLIMPFIIKIGIEELGYEKLFELLIMPYYLLTIASLFIYVPRPRQFWAHLSLLYDFFKQQAVRNIVIVSFAAGVGASFNPLLDVVILEKLGSLNGWQNMSFAVTVCGIIVARVLKSVNIHKQPGKAKSIIAFGSMLYALIPIMFFSNFTLTVFLAFNFAKMFYDKTSIILRNAITLDAQKSDPDFINKVSSYEWLIQSANVLGDLLPLLVLFLLKDNLQINGVVFGLIIVTFVPFYFAGRIGGQYKHSFESAQS